MIPFPLPIHRSGGNHKKITLDDMQLSWLRKYYPITENAVLAEAMGISKETVRVLAREDGLKKSAEGMRAIQKRQGVAMARTQEAMGYYAARRGKPFNDAAQRGNIKRWEDERAGLRENAMLKMKREQPERYAAMIEKKRVERKESIRKEKMRVLYGLERKTKIRAVVMCPFKPSQRHHRCKALKLGYLLDEDCAEGSPYRYIIFYDDETRRSPRFEENCIKDGFRIERDGG